MGIVKGGALRFIQTGLYLLSFCCSAIILGIYSYFLAVLADRNIHISRDDKAVEGLSGVAVVYLIFATILTCCLGGINVFAILGLILDVCFIGAMVAIAVLTRDGAHSCRGYVYTPIGDGPSSSHGPGFHDGNHHVITYEVSLRTACRLNTACFAVSIAAAVLFLCTAVMQLALMRNHNKESRYGPGPSNGYTSGSGSKKFWQKNGTTNGVARDAEAANM